MPQVGRFIRAVPLREWPAILMALLVAVLIEVGLRLMRLPTLARLAGAPLQMDGPADFDDQPMRARFVGKQARRVSAVQRVMRHWPVDGNCLRQALVLGNRLRRDHPQLRIGVRKDETGMLRAHAWLEVDGRTLDPIGNATFLGLTPVRGAQS